MPAASRGKAAGLRRIPAVRGTEIERQGSTLTVAAQISLTENVAAEHGRDTWVS
jgi:hypothetical protein